MIRDCVEQSHKWLEAGAIAPIMEEIYQHELKGFARDSRRSRADYRMRSFVRQHPVVMMALAVVLFPFRKAKVIGLVATFALPTVATAAAYA